MHKIKLKTLNGNFIDAYVDKDSLSNDEGVFAYAQGRVCKALQEEENPNIYIQSSKAVDLFLLNFEYIQANYNNS